MLKNGSIFKGCKSRNDRKLTIQSGALLVVSEVTTPLIGFITTVIYL